MNLYISRFSRNLIPLNRQLMLQNFRLFQNNRAVSQIVRQRLSLQQNLLTQSFKTQSFRRSFSFSRPCFFYRNYSSIPTQNSLVEKSTQMKKTFDSLSRLSKEEQREKMIVFLAREFGFPIQGKKIDRETMKKFLEFTSRDDEIPSSPYKGLMLRQEWDFHNWNFALSILFRRFAISREIDWLSDKRKEKNLPKIKGSMWIDAKMPLYLPGKRELDKEAGLEISTKKATEWIAQNPNGKITAIQEGIWDGNFLIELYINLTSLNIHTNLIGTDINPVSLVLFILKCGFLKIPSKNFSVYFNSLHDPINPNEVEQRHPFYLSAQVLNIYFRTILDLEEEEVLKVFEKKAREINPDDILIVTLVEETQSSLKALQEIKLEEEKAGEFFVKYSNSKQSSIRKSSVLVLKKGFLQKLQAHLKKSFQLEVYEQKKTNIHIDSHVRQSTLFEAVVVAFQLKK